MDRLDERIEQKYFVPLGRPASNLAGVELELPIVCLEQKPVDFSLVHRMTGAFVSHFGFSKISRDDEGEIFSATDERSGDTLSFDCSYNTLEFSFAPDENLQVVRARFLEYYTFVEDFLFAQDHTLTGMGINPHHAINHRTAVPNGRYRMLLHHLSTYERYRGERDFHPWPDFGLFSCSSQVQLDVDRDNVLTVLNTFNALEPFKAVLLANSAWEEEPGKLLCRDDFWDRSLHGFNPHNTGMYAEPFTSLQELRRYIRSESLFCVNRGEKTLNFRPTPLEEYFAAGQMSGEYYDPASGKYREITFTPKPEDLHELRSYKSEDLTFRGTVEFRSVCEQPVREIFASAALHAGLMQRVEELQELLLTDEVLYHHGYGAAELRRMMSREELPDFVDRRALREKLVQILDLAREGLELRGRGEEDLLSPLDKRAQTLTSPAREMLQRLRSGETMREIVLDYARTR